MDIEFRFDRFFSQLFKNVVLLSSGYHERRWHVLCHFSCVRLCVTMWTVACQVPLSVGFPRQEILEWVAISFSRGFSQPGIEPKSLRSSALASGFLTCVTWEAPRRWEEDILEVLTVSHCLLDGLKEDSKTGEEEIIPGGPVVGTTSTHCWGPGFNPWSQKQDPTNCVMAKKKKKKIRNLLPLECIPFNVVYHFPLVVLDFVCVFGF